MFKLAVRFYLTLERILVLTQMVLTYGTGTLLHVETSTATLPFASNFLSGNSLMQQKNQLHHGIYLGNSNNDSTYCNNCIR